MCSDYIRSVAGNFQLIVEGTINPRDGLILKLDPEQELCYQQKGFQSGSHDTRASNDDQTHIKSWEPNWKLGSAYPSLSANTD